MRKRRAKKIIVSWWLSVLQWLLVRYVKVDEAWLESVRRATENGRVVFVLRNRSLIDFLCLRGLCERYGLPRISYVEGISLFLYSPIWFWIIRLFTPAHHDERKRRLGIALRSGGSGLVFLRRPASIGTVGSRPVKVDGIRVAVDVHSTLQAPIIALPTVFLWGESAMKRFPGTMDFFFGSNEYPRIFRSIWLLIRRRSVHELIVGDPLDLNSIQRERGVEDDALVGVVRAFVGRQIEMIRRARLGSLTKPSARVKAEVLGSPRLLRELGNIAREHGIPANEVVPKARGIIKKLAADFHPRILPLFAVIMAFVWKRIYTGIDFSKEDMEKMKSMVSRGPTLILPTHKSHIDYLVISQVMHSSNMMLPHIAAGQNLSFWPLGFLFRSSGAFFIRRKFINDKFYTAVVNAYVRRLVQEGYSIEIFIEGGRSRTGKLLRPKLGMLEMAIQALSVAPRLDLGIVPVFIGYERVIEETVYVKESMGKQKKAESIKGLIKSTKVLMSRYGRLYVRVGEPFTVNDILEEMGLTRSNLSKISTRRDVALEVGFRNYAAINAITVITPSAVLATVLLANREANIEHSLIRVRALFLVEFLLATGAVPSEFVSKWQELNPSNDGRDDLLDRTVRALVKGGRIASKRKSEHVSYTIRDDQRLPLDYYKNNTIHFLVPASLVTTSCLIRGESEVGIGQIADDVALAAKFFQWEFMLQAGHSKSTGKEIDFARSFVEDALVHLVAQNVLERDGDMVRVIDRDKAIFLSDVLRNFQEAYFAVISTIRAKVFGEIEGDTAKGSVAFAQEKLKSGHFIKPEASSRINIQNAIQAFKDLKILRPVGEDRPFDEGNLGDLIFRYLSSIIDLK